MTPTAPAALKACCATAYASPAARYLLGQSFHPGGARLTSELGRSLRLAPGSVVVDVGSGPGTSAVQLARETGCHVVGIDLAVESIAEARRAAGAAGVAEHVEFLEGDAEALPLPDASMDGVLSECALCTFPDKPAAIAEMRRALCPGGTVALADVTAQPGRLPSFLRGAVAQIACVAAAQSAQECVNLLVAAGFEVEASERHDAELAKMADRVEARLRAARIIAPRALEQLRPDLDDGIELAHLARKAIAAGDLGYAVWVARLPAAAE